MNLSLAFWILLWILGCGGYRCLRRRRLEEK
jgi:hypothetical protein